MVFIGATRTISVMNKLENDYQIVVYTNLLTDDLLTAADFFDADHLNEIGAEKFTQKLTILSTALSVNKAVNVAKFFLSYWAITFYFDSRILSFNSMIDYI